MRKTKPPQLPANAGWYAALAAAGDVVYPRTDPMSARPVGRGPAVDYMSVYNRVILGTPESPGILSPEFLQPANADEPPYYDLSQPRSLSEANLVEVENTIGGWLQDYLDRQNVIYQGRQASIDDFNSAISAAAAEGIRGVGETPAALGRAFTALKNVMRDEFGIPIPSSRTLRESWDSTLGRVFRNRRDTETSGQVLPPTSMMLRRQQEAFEGREQRATPQQMVEQTQQRAAVDQGRPLPSESTMRVGPRSRVSPERRAAGSNSRRVLDLVNSLDRSMRTQSFTEIPLGFAETDFLQVDNPESVRLRAESEAIMDRTESMPNSPEKAALVEQASELLRRAEALPARIMMFAPGRAPMTPAQRRASDFFQRVRSQPGDFTPGGVTLTSAILSGTSLREEQMRAGQGPMIAGAAEEQTWLGESDIGPIVRGFYQRGELGALKQRLIATGFITNPDAIRDMNAPDEITRDALREVAAYAQEQGIEWEEGLARLENDPEYMTRIADMRRRSTPTVTYRLPSDDDLTAVFKAVSRSTIGRELPQEAYDSMIAAYKPQLMNYQRQLQGGGTVTEPPQAETFAATQIGERYRAEEFSYSLGNQLNNFMQLLGGGM